MRSMPNPCDMVKLRQCQSMERCHACPFPRLLVICFCQNNVLTNGFSRHGLKSICSLQLISLVDLAQALSH